MASQQKPTTNAVLYVCAERSRSAFAPTRERADEEGRAFANIHGLALVDTYGDLNPQAREGWQSVRAMAAAGNMSVVITRWPNAISPDHERRYTEISDLQTYGVRVLFSWAPLRLQLVGH